MSLLSFDVVIVGAGAAGLMCAIQAAKRGRRVALLEHNAEIGRKILISGGGRCNFTNIHATPENYISENPNFCKSALARFSPSDMVEFIEQYDIAYHEKTLGQLFCNNSARQLVTALEQECRERGVTLLCSCSVSTVSKTDRFRIETSRGVLEASSLVVATGGLSFAKLGATGFGYDLARQFGLQITSLRPGLVPLRCDGESMAKYRNLSGVSLPVHCVIGRVGFHEALLFTHRGISGPAVLQISSFWKKSDDVTIDILPHFKGEEWLTHRQSSQSFTSVLGSLVPSRFAEVWANDHGVDKIMRHWSNAEVTRVSQHLHGWSVPISDTEGYPKAEVTVGGVDTRMLSSKTMEARNVPGLYFIGEVVDVTGWLGGYNFQWAWASAHAAGAYV